MLRKIASLGSIQLVGILLNVVRSKVFAVLLGPAGFGVVATIDQLVITVVQVFHLSLPSTALKFLSHSHSLGEDKFRRSYAAFFKAIAFLATIATIVTVAAVPPNLARLDAQLAPFRGPVTIALLGIPATMMLIYFYNVLAARQEGVRSGLLTVVSGAVILIAGTVGCLLDGISGIYIAVVPASTILVIALIIVLWKKAHLPVWAKSASVWAELSTDSKFVEVTFCLYVAGASASIQLFLARYVTLTNVSAEAAGLLQACLAVALSIGAVVGSASVLYYRPHVNRAIPAAEKIEATGRFVPRLILIYCLGGLLVLLFPESVLALLFSTQFAPAVAILPWFVAWQCVFQVSNVYQQLLIGFDDARGFAWVTVSGNLVAAVLCLLLVDRLSQLGIAIGFIVGAMITALLTGVRLRRNHGIAIPWSTVACMAFTLLGFSAVAAVGYLTGEMTLAGLGARSLTALVFLTGLWLVLPSTLRADVAGEFSTRLRAWRGD